MHACVYVHTHVIYMWLPRWRSAKESACQCRRCKRRGLDPGTGSSPGEGNGNPLQYSCLKNLMDRGAWQATVQGVVRIRHNWETEHASTHTHTHTHTHTTHTHIYIKFGIQTRFINSKYNTWVIHSHSCYKKINYF